MVRIMIRIKGRCLVCNAATKHHHYYCDEHYPKEHNYRNIIRNMKIEIRKKDAEIHKLKQQIIHNKSNFRKELEKARSNDSR